MKRQGLEIFGFLFLTQLFFGIASYFILMFSAGSKILAAYMCSAVCCIYGVVVLIWHKKGIPTHGFGRPYEHWQL